MKGKFLIKTWGCQMNIHDSEKLSGLLSQMDYSPCANEHEADLIILNTCSVREKAYQKVFSYLGKLKPLKEKNSDLIIGVCGCVAQHEKENLFKKAPYINFLMGPRSIASLKNLIEESQSGYQPIDLEFRDDFLNLSHHNILRQTYPKAYLTIMEGCNRACSYCIVPQTRGREVHRTFADIVLEARCLAEQGFLEIELLGQNVNSYLSSDKGFHDLLIALSLVKNIKRLRFTTSHPAQLNMNIMNQMKDNEKVCNHLHLPVQSGSTKILNLMNRGYSRQDFIKEAKWLKQNIKGFTLSTDIIVGFPGERENDFNDTLSLIEEIEFDQIYSFVYSPRPNTSAEALGDDISHSIKMERLYHLQSKQYEIQKRLNEQWIGKIVNVLVDGFSQKNHSMLTGRTTNNKIVNFKEDSSSIGKLLDVCITQSSIHSLNGEIIR